MAKQTTPNATAKNAPVENTPQPTVNGENTPQMPTAEIPVIPPTDEKKPDVPPVAEKVEPTIDELRAAKKAAVQNLFTVEMNDESTDEQKKAAKVSLDNAEKAVNTKLASIMAEKAKADAIAARTGAIQTIATALNVDAKVITDLLEADEKLEAKDRKFTDAFGTISGKTHIAKENQTGKSLTAAGNSNGTEKSGTNTTTEIKALLTAGKTVDEIEAMGYKRKTVSDIRWHWKKENNIA